MTQVFDTDYNPIVTLSTVDTSDGVLDTAALVMHGITRYDWAVLGEIVAQCGRTRRGAALARAYLCDGIGR